MYSHGWKTECLTVCEWCKAPTWSDLLKPCNGKTATRRSVLPCQLNSIYTDNEKMNPQAFDPRDYKLIWFKSMNRNDGTHTSYIIHLASFHWLPFYSTTSLSGWHVSNISTRQKETHWRVFQAFKPSVRSLSTDHAKICQVTVNHWSDDQKGTLTNRTPICDLAKSLGILRAWLFTKSLILHHAIPNPTWWIVMNIDEWTLMVTFSDYAAGSTRMAYGSSMYQT